MAQVEPALDEIPGSVRIRCGTENAKRYKAIHRLQHITGINRTDSIIRAVRYYNRMHGVETAGVLSELMDAAESRGSLTASEIAEIVDAPELPVEYESEYSVG